MTGKTLQEIVREKCNKPEFQGLPEKFSPLLDELNRITEAAGFSSRFNAGELLPFTPATLAKNDHNSDAYTKHVIAVINNMCRFVLMDRFPEKLGPVKADFNPFDDTPSQSGLTISQYKTQASTLDSKNTWTPFVNVKTLAISEFYLALLKKIIELDETKELDLTFPVPGLVNDAILALSFRVYTVAANQELTNSKNKLTKLLSTDTQDLEKLLDELHNFYNELNKFNSKPAIERLHTPIKNLSKNKISVIANIITEIEIFLRDTTPKIAKQISELEEQLLQQLTTEYKTIQPLEIVSEPNIVESKSLEEVGNQITAVKQCISAYSAQLKTTREQIKQLEKMNQTIQKITLDSLLVPKQALQKNIEDTLKNKREQLDPLNNKIGFFKTLLGDLSLKYDELELGVDISLEEIDSQIKVLKTELNNLKTNLDKLEKTRSDSETQSSETHSVTSEKTTGSKASSAPGTPSKSAMSSDERLKGLIANLYDSTSKELGFSNKSSKSKKQVSERNLLKSIVQDISNYKYTDLLKDLGVQHTQKNVYTNDFANILNIEASRYALINKIIEKRPDLDPKIQPFNDNASVNISDDSGSESENNVSADFSQITTEQLANKQKVIDQIKLDIETKTTDLDKLVFKKRPSQILITAGKAIKQKLIDLNKLITIELINLNSDNPMDLEKIKTIIKDINTALTEHNVLVSQTEIKPVEFKEKVTNFIDKFLTSELTDLVTILNNFSSDEKIKNLQAFVTTTNVAANAFSVFDHNQSAKMHPFLTSLLAVNGEHSVYVIQKQINAIHEQFSALTTEFSTITLKHNLKIDDTAINDLNININQLVKNLEKTNSTLKAEDDLYEKRDKTGATPILRGLVENFEPNSKNTIKSLINENYKLDDLAASLKSLANEVHSNGTAVYEANQVKKVQAEVYDALYQKQTSKLNWLLAGEIIAWVFTPFIFPAILAGYLHSKRTNIKENGLVKVDTTVKELHSTDKIWNRLQNAKVPPSVKQAEEVQEPAAVQESHDIEAGVAEEAILKAPKNTSVISKNDDNVLKRQFYNDKHEPLTKADIKNLAENIEANGNQYIQIVMTKKQAETYKDKVEAAKGLHHILNLKK